MVKHFIVAKTITRQVAHLTNYKTMLRVLDDLKYLHRLNKQEFWDLVFPNALEHYFEPKWTLFQKDKLSFLWSCSADKIKILVNFINNCRDEDYEV